jgi:hypothetical protein
MTENILTREEIAIYRAMSPMQKLALVDRFYRDARALKRAALRTLRPQWTEEEIEQKLDEIFLNATE